MNSPGDRSGHDAISDRVADVLTPHLAGLGLDLEAVEVHPAASRRVLRVAVDKDGGVTMDDVADATRAVSEVLDETGVMGERAYTLEVTSRGVDRPLTLPRHWRRNAGRLVKVTTVGAGESLTGRIGDSDDTGVTVDVAEEPRRLEYADIGRALVQIEFSRRHEEES